jgi:hypothetical protein
MTACYRIAGRIIGIDPLYPRVEALCAPYRADGAPELVVRATPEDIARERAAAGADYPDDYLETLAVYRQIAEAMPRWDTVLFHGSAVEVDGAAYLFTAPSGTGKSTHARLWRELLGPRARMINDDKPLLRVGAAGVTVYGTPWNGKHGLGENASAPLRAVCFLSRGRENAISPVGAAAAYPLLLPQVYRPRDARAMKKTLALLDGLCRHVRFYRLACNMEPDAARLSYETMRPQETPLTPRAGEPACGSGEDLP